MVRRSSFAILFVLLSQYWTGASDAAGVGTAVAAGSSNGRCTFSYTGTGKTQGTCRWDASDESPNDTRFYTVNAVATADYGSLGVGLIGIQSTGDNASGQSRLTGSAGASNSDRLYVTGAPATGTLEIRFGLSGAATLVAQGPGWDTFGQDASAVLSASLSATGPLGRLDQVLYRAQVNRIAGAAPIISNTTYSLPFVSYGGSFSVKLSVRLNGFFNCGTHFVTQVGTADCTAVVSAGNTLTVLGASVLDENMQEVAGATITSDSGFDYQAGVITDSDDDGIPDADDNCPTDANPSQQDTDDDGHGDACDDDDDNDGVPDEEDAFPSDPNEWSDNDLDEIGDNADADDDNDGQLDTDEQACGSDPLSATSKSPDFDGDDIPDCVDSDHDGDNVANPDDVCPETVIPESVPTSSRGLGKNRWTLDNTDGVFTQGPPQESSIFSFSTADTHGCSCEQIVDVAELGNAHNKYGCSTSAMLDWINSQ